MQSNKAIKKLKQRNKLPEVILEFVPNPTFEKEFLEFVESLINCFKSEKNLNLKENENGKFSNN
jgi:hypothetical protein